jgi:hypothetical protein
MSSPEYILEKHPHGWLLCAPPGKTGIRLAALAERFGTFNENEVIHPGIAHHFNAKDHKNVVVCVVTPAGGAAWEKEIAESLQDLHPEARWWLGTDVGKSSAAVFAVFASRWVWAARSFAEGATPSDAADFGRCKRLLEAFPHWRPRLHEVAAAYPDTAWPAIIARWPELEAAATGNQVNEVLSAAHGHK